MKIFLATMESQCSYLSRASIKARNAFISFYTFSRFRDKARLVKVLYNVRSIVTGLITCDSGAHTFFAEVPEKGFSASGHNKKTKTKMGIDEYFEKYLQFLKEFGQYLDYFVELDIGEIVGQEKVEGWREVLKKEGLFKKCITCYHPSIMNLDYFEKMCKESESRYVAVEGDRPMQRRGRLDYTTLIKIARKNNCKIHGFAMTKPDALSMFPFFSVDSSSWNAIMVYGKSGIRKTYGKTRDFESVYIKTYEGRGHLLLKEIEAWNKMEDFYTNLWKIRGVEWLDN